MKNSFATTTELHFYNFSKNCFYCLLQWITMKLMRHGKVMVRVLFCDLDVGKGNDKGSSTPQHQVVVSQLLKYVSWERLKQSCFWQTFRKSLTSFCRQWSLHLLPLMSNLKSLRIVLWDLEVKLKACVEQYITCTSPLRVLVLELLQLFGMGGGGGTPWCVHMTGPGNDCSYRNTYWV